MTDSALTGFDLWRRRALALALVCTAVLLAACGGGSSSGAAAPQAAVQPADTVPRADSPTISPAPVPTSPAAKFARFAYVTNETDNTLSIYMVHAATGQLRHKGYALTGSGPKAVAVDAAGKFAYVVNSASNNVSAYAIDPATGALSVVAGSPFATGVAPQAITVDPSGRFAYVTNLTAGSGGSVSAFAIDAATGALAAIAGSPFAAGAYPYSVVAERSGKFLYVANGAGNVSAYAIHATTGALAAVAGSPFTSGNGSYFVTADPSGRFIYVANGGSGTIAAFVIDPASGVLTSAGSTRTTATGLRTLAIDPAGKFMYAANISGNNVLAYTIHATTGALTEVAGSPFAAGTNPWTVVVDASGSFVYAGNQRSNDVSAWRIDGVTGGLTALPKVASRVGPSAIAMTSGAAAVVVTPKSLYASNYGQQDVSSYTINAQAGGLTHNGNTPAGISLGTSVAVDPAGRFAYTTHDTQNPEFPVHEKIVIHTINPASGSGGTLTRTGAVVIASEGPWSIRIDPTGRFAYVAHVRGDILAFRINATTGNLSEIGWGATGPSGNAFAIDPTGRFMYVANAYELNVGSGSISALSINPLTGELTPIDLNGSLAGVELTTGPNPSSVAVDPSGRFVYVTHRNGVEAYLIDPASGRFINTTSVLADVLAADPWSVAVDPSGRFAYVANRGTDDVTAYRIDPAHGWLTRIGTVAVGDYPSSITVDASGQFVYVANMGSNTLSALRIDAVTGALTLIGNVASGRWPSGITTTWTTQ